MPTNSPESLLHFTYESTGTRMACESPVRRFTFLYIDLVADRMSFASYSQLYSRVATAVNTDLQRHGKSVKVCGIRYKCFNTFTVLKCFERFHHRDFFLPNDRKPVSRAPPPPPPGSYLGFQTTAMWLSLSLVGFVFGCSQDSSPRGWVSLWVFTRQQS